MGATPNERAERRSFDLHQTSEKPENVSVSDLTWISGIDGTIAGILGNVKYPNRCLIHTGYLLFYHRSKVKWTVACLPSQGI